MPEWPGNSPRNAFKQALSNCQRQIGLWSAGSAVRWRQRSLQVRASIGL